MPVFRRDKSVLGASLSLALLAATSLAQADLIRVDTTPGNALNRFKPLHALGGGIDRMPKESVDPQFEKSQVEAVLSSGWGAVSYRINTELKIEAWHWNPRGTWSDKDGAGYFTGSDSLGEPIGKSYGYRLPHRGHTQNEGSEKVGYSRLTDGDSLSYWKSNPYLAPVFTKEDEAKFPQWIVLDMGDPASVDAIRIEWADPYAQSYEVQYFTGDEAIDDPTKGEWKTFPEGAIKDAKGGVITHKLASKPIRARWFRVTMTNSSGTCDNHGSQDRRNCLGYAIYEVGLGTLGPKGEFRDKIKHSPDQEQTNTHCSSIDPWHRKTDLDEEAGAQAGLDLVFSSGITQKLPTMVAVAVVYGTPEDAAAQVSYMKKRGYPLSYIEMGEEPDGQYMLPEHYAALYLQVADAIHKVDPSLKLGGPSFSGFTEDRKVWPDKDAGDSWTKRFLKYLSDRNRIKDFAFLSFEHYPYEPYNIVWDDLYKEPKLIEDTMKIWRDAGLSPDVPVHDTEVNISWAGVPVFMEIFGALWHADYVGAFLAAGGDGTYYFNYLPQRLEKAPIPGNFWGAYSMFTMDKDYRIQDKTSQYYASRLIAREWVKPGEEQHELYRASCDIRDGMGRVPVTSYAVKRPDGLWSLLLVNKDRNQAQTVRVVFENDATDHAGAFTGDVTQLSFGTADYEWKSDGEKSHVVKAKEPTPTTRPSGAGVKYTLPKASVTVLRGTVK